MDYKTEFSERLKKLCESKEMTQTALAQVMNKSQQGISNWMQGKAQPSLEDVCRLADAFGVSVQYLMTGYEAGAMDIGKATGLSQRAIDDLTIWNTAQDAPGLVNGLLTLQSQISKTDHIMFDRIIGNVINAMRIRKIAADEEAQRQRDPNRILKDGVKIDDNTMLLYSTMIDGLVAQSGEVFTALIREYIRREMVKYAPKDNP